MYQEKEIEFKSGLTEDKYLKLIALLSLKDQVYTQENYYFETPNLDLLACHIMVRIREKKDSLNLTLKKSGQNGSIEQHYLISKIDKNELIQKGFNLNKYFANYDFEVAFVGKNKTERATTSYLGGTLFLDKTYVTDLTFYEVELEHDNYDEGEKVFKRFLKEFKIPFRKIDSKSFRTFKAYDLMEK